MSTSVQWPDKSLPVSISCAPGLLTALEIVATDGLLAMPRIGLGVGGLLLGRRSGDRIEILRSVEILCSHARGPSFMLTPDEVKATVLLPESGDEEVDPAERQVVGWYCTKTQESLELTDHDHELFDAFCPNGWQALLLIRPAKGKPTKAAFGFRQMGKPYTQGEWLDLAWQELAGFELPPVPEPVAIPPFAKAAAVAAAEAAPLPPPVRVPEPPVDIPVAMPSVGTLFGEPGPRRVREAKEAKAAAKPKPKKQKAERPWKFNLLIAAIVLVVLAMAALLIRGILGS